MCQRKSHNFLISLSLNKEENFFKILSRVNILGKLYKRCISILVKKIHQNELLTWSKSWPENKTSLGDYFPNVEESQLCIPYLAICRSRIICMHVKTKFQNPRDTVSLTGKRVLCRGNCWHIKLVNVSWMRGQKCLWWEFPINCLSRWYWYIGTAYGFRGIYIHYLGYHIFNAPGAHTETTLRK